MKWLSCVRLFVTSWTYHEPTKILSPWDFPGKNTGVGCHFLLQGMKKHSKTMTWLGHMFYVGMEVLDSGVHAVGYYASPKDTGGPICRLKYPVNHCFSWPECSKRVHYSATLTHLCIKTGVWEPRLPTVFQPRSALDSVVLARPTPNKAEDWERGLLHHSFPEPIQGK